MLALVAACAALAAPAPPDRLHAHDLLGPRYAIDAEVSFTAGLFQWVDSLAGTSVGKTIPAHREDFVRRFGSFSPDDLEAIRRFREARVEHLRRTGSASALLGIFCGAPSVESALDEVGIADLRAALTYLRPKYERVWDGGRIPGDFLDAVRRDGGGDRLADELVRVARFLRVDPALDPRPRLVLVPVPPGWGTHAQAIGRQLLIEIRPGDRLADEAAVVMHENAHFLMAAIPEARRDALRRIALAAGPKGEAAWSALHEALPTALGQGYADRRWRPRRWSRRAPWYHLPEIDVYAKRIYPMVQEAVDAGGAFDEEFVRRAVALWRGGSATPR